MGAKEQVDAMLAECGATLTRAKKHEIWLFPNGQKFTRAQTSSDRLADHNNLSDLKHALGIVKTEATNGVRRTKKLTAGKDKTVAYTKANGASLADTLRATGVAEKALRDDIELLQERIASLSTLNAALIKRSELWAKIADQFREDARACWMCRLRGWVKQKREAGMVIFRERF